MAATSHLPAQPFRPTATFPVWPSVPPGALGSLPEDIPTLTVYQPSSEKVNGVAVVVCPGGGYWELMEDREGRDFALWLNERGITAFVLKYRLASRGYHHPEITSDVIRALRHIRSHAAQWKIDPRCIGVMGGSAGGHLASYALTRGDQGNPLAEDPVERANSRPDFGILCYPMIDIKPRNRNLLGDNPVPGLAEELSTHLKVTADTPPCFLWHTSDDKIVNAANSLKFAAALQAHGVRYSLYIQASGEHGLGLGLPKGEVYDPGASQKLHPWTAALSQWLQEQILAGRVVP